VLRISRQRSTCAAGRASLRVGEPFNPFGLFNGSWIPEVLLRAKGISPGAKLIYGRLTRYAGTDGECYPAVPTLAAEVALSVRQTQKYLSELERVGLIRRIPKISKSGQTSNDYVFLWHTLFEGAVKKATPGRVSDPAPEGVNDRSPKESQSEESQVEESPNIDLDYPPTNRKKRYSQVDDEDDCSGCRQYPRLREAIADYMMAPDDDERVYPTDRLVVDVMDAAAGATEEAVIRCLRYLKDERGLLPGTRHGPRRFGWFKTVVGDYFRQKSSREAVFALPVTGDHNDSSRLSKAEFDDMTEALE
jgi:hypothetical protein